MPSSAGCRPPPDCSHLAPTHHDGPAHLLRDLVSIDAVSHPKDPVRKTSPCRLLETAERAPTLAELARRCSPGSILVAASDSGPQAILACCRILFGNDRLFVAVRRDSLRATTGHVVCRLAPVDAKHTGGSFSSRTQAAVEPSPWPVQAPRKRRILRLPKRVQSSQLQRKTPVPEPSDSRAANGVSTAFARRTLPSRTSGAAVTRRPSLHDDSKAKD